MQRFRRMKSLQKFASIHASLHNHFNQERHLTDRQTYKERHSAALAEWQSLAACSFAHLAKAPPFGDKLRLDCLHLHTSSGGERRALL